MQMHNMFNVRCTTHTTVLSPCVWHTSSDFIQSSLIFCLSDRHMKHNIKHISFLHEYAVQFNTEEAYERKKSYEKCHKKFRTWFPGVLVPLKSTVCEVMNKFHMTGSLLNKSDSKHKLLFEKKHT